ncbi:hypothetical protein T12_455 [Trichinella patagoniensis]|uniref:Uncharacterized protein n=1 Tax=Trichinella patagoniensis TaxID=990121 RepID=A0A0V1ACP5_9BILA|nr:hypothetical protein T12_455 [Trichinella patagoniensis]
MYELLDWFCCTLGPLAGDVSTVGIIGRSPAFSFLLQAMETESLLKTKRIKCANRNIPEKSGLSPLNKRRSTASFDHDHTIEISVNFQTKIHSNLTVNKGTLFKSR